MTTYKYVSRIAWTQRGLLKFEEAVNSLLRQGYEPQALEIHKGFFRYVCIAILSAPVDKCECTCPCCIEIHQGSCNCECDCCQAHAHRDGSYPSGDEDED